MLRRTFLAGMAAALLAPAQNTTNMRGAYAELPGVRLFYIDSGGTGVPVIFLHPASGTTRSWEHQIDAFTSAGYRFIAYDRRGWGRSEVVSSSPQPGTAADDLEALRDYLKIESFHLVGSAAGGGVALDYALAFPKRLKTLVVASSNGGVVDERYNEMSNRLHPPEMLTSLPPHIRELGPSYRAADPGGTDRWLEIEKASRLPGSPAQPTRNRMTFSSLEAIAIPTLFIAGGADLYAPPPVVKLFADRVRGAQLVAIPEAGHSAFWEAPDRFNAAVLRFLRDH